MKKMFVLGVFICLFLSGCCCKNPNEVIRFSTWGSASEMSILEPIVRNFEYENPGIKVEILHIPQDYFQKLHLLFASKMEPDVILINNQNIPIYSKYLFSLNDFIETDLYFKQALSSMSENGVIYALPRDCSGLVVYYNKSLFDKNNVKYPQENWSLEDMRNIARQLTSKTNWGMSYEPSIYYAQPFMHYFGGGVCFGDGSGTEKGIDLYKSFAYKYHYAPVPSDVGSKTLAQMFLDGKIAMHISGRWLVPKYRSCASFQWDVINFPKYSASSDSTGWAISKRSKHKDSARKFVIYLSSYDSISKFTRSGLIVPARKDVANSKVFRGGLPLHSDVFIKSVEKSDITHVNFRYNKEVERLNDMYLNSGN